MVQALAIWGDQFVSQGEVAVPEIVEGNRRQLRGNAVDGVQRRRISAWYVAASAATSPSPDRLSSRAPYGLRTPACAVPSRGEEWATGCCAGDVGYHDELLDAESLASAPDAPPPPTASPSAR